MSRATFTIAYDGPALSDHSMDVRDLAPAMLALGQLCDAANAVLNGSASKIKVHVVATSPGSFEIGFEIIQSYYQQALSLLTGPEVTAVANLKALIFGGTIMGMPTLLDLIKKLRGRTPSKTIPLPDDMVRITIGDQTMDIPLALLRLYQDLPVRTAVQKVVEEPLKKDGFTSFEVREGKNVTIKIDEAEATYFAKPEIADDTLIDTVRTSAFSIISLAFKEDNKWRLNDGTNSISANIEDKDFLTRVDNNQVSFSKGDILICEVRVIQKQTEQGLKTDYTIIRVVEHRPAARQIPLPFEKPD
jgi:hypothetical protein